MLLVLAATNRGSKVKSLEYQIFGKIRKQGCFFYETIQASEIPAIPQFPSHSAAHNHLL